jgi:hypothetical protein
VIGYKNLDLVAGCLKAEVDYINLELMAGCLKVENLQALKMYYSHL